jgi:hypothetical protein
MIPWCSRGPLEFRGEDSYIPRRQQYRKELWAKHCTIGRQGGLLGELVPEGKLKEWVGLVRWGGKKTCVHFFFFFFFAVLGLELRACARSFNTRGTGTLQPFFALVIFQMLFAVILLTSVSLVVGIISMYHPLSLEQLHFYQSKNQTIIMLSTWF